MANLPSACLCFFDAIVELHPMNEKVLIDFLIGECKWIVYVINAYLFLDLYCVYVVEAFIVLN